MDEQLMTKTYRRIENFYKKVEKVKTNNNE